MDARVVNSFINAARNVMKSYLTDGVEVGKVTVRSSCYPSGELNILLGVLGKMRGEIVYGMSLDTAKAVVSKMMGGAEVTEMDEMAISAIGEFGNMISGNATTNMSNQGIECNLSPPLVIIGHNVEVHTLQIKALNIPLNTEVGEISMNVALEEV